jgi:predicted permease
VPASAAHGIARWGQKTIAIQVAFSLVLLVEAGLFARSLSALRGIDTGVASGSEVLMAYVRPIDGRSEVATIVSLARQLSDRPGTIDAQSVSFSMDTPLGGISMSKSIHVPGGPPRDTRETVSFNYVGPRFFKTTGIAVDGRDIRPEDDERAPAVAVISRSVANKYFPGVNAVGRRIRDERTEFEVVGVAADVKYNGLRERASETVYLPYLQGRTADGVGAISVVVRTAGDAQRATAGLRREVRAHSRDLVIALVQTLEERMDAALVRERAVATLSMWFATLALLLGCVGLYGTLAYAVVRRIVEFGIRLALGADTRRLTSTVIAESLRPVVIGLLIGVPLALAVCTLSEGLLFGVTGGDVVTYAFAITALIAAAVGAVWFPARRAAVVDPIVALRCE